MEKKHKNSKQNDTAGSGLEGEDITMTFRRQNRQLVTLCQGQDIFHVIGMKHKAMVGAQQFRESLQRAIVDDEGGLLVLTGHRGSLVAEEDWLGDTPALHHPLRNVGFSGGGWACHDDVEILGPGLDRQDLSWVELLGGLHADCCWKVGAGFLMRVFL